MTEILIKTGIAYLMGSILGALLVGKIFGGVDIRKVGSGNAGGTNALRTQGIWFALLVIVVDIGKGALASGWLPGLTLPGVPESSWSHLQLATVCGAASVVGHVFPIFYGFKGGKGVATLVGAVVALSVEPALIALACFVVVLVLTGFVGLSSILATASLVVYAWSTYGLESSWFWFGLAMLVFVVFTHRGNIKRMLKGTEDRKRAIMVFHRWLGS